MLLHIIRHGDPNYETDSLTERGRAEADAVALRLAQRPISQVWSSSMGRAQQTAAPTAAALGLQVQVVDWARELSSPRVDDGRGNHGMVFWNVAGEYVRSGQVDPEAWDDFEMYSNPEDLDLQRSEVNRVLEGSDGFLAGLGLTRQDGVYRIDADLPDEVAIFCHGGVIVTWLGRLLHIPTALAWSGFFPATTSVTTVWFEQRSPQFVVPRMMAVGDTGHLLASGLGENLQGRPQKFY